MPEEAERERLEAAIKAAQIELAELTTHSRAALRGLEVGGKISFIYLR